MTDPTASFGGPATGPGDEIRFSQQPDFQPSPSVSSIGMLDRLSAAMAGRVQIEGGYVFKHYRFAHQRVVEHTLPDMLLRVGLTDRLELRIGWPGWVSTNYQGEGISHSSSQTLNPNFGFMFDLWSQHGWLPQTAVLASVPIPLQGSDSFALDSAQPLTGLLYAWYLTDRLSFGGTTGVALFDEDGDHYLQFQQRLNFDYLCTDRLGMFVEWEMLADHGSVDDGCQHLLGTGFSYLLTERLQTSLRIGFGLNDRAPDFLTGIHFAYRF